MAPHDPHFYDCPNLVAGKPCGGKASLPAGQGRAAFKCTRCGKVTAEAELRRISMKRNLTEDD
jgi:tRNA(Ile2) C34 agmatinyltransferase TiaS